MNESERCFPTRSVRLTALYAGYRPLIRPRGSNDIELLLESAEHITDTKLLADFAAKVLQILTEETQESGRAKLKVLAPIVRDLHHRSPDRRAVARLALAHLNEIRNSRNIFGFDEGFAATTIAADTVETTAGVTGALKATAGVTGALKTTAGVTGALETANNILRAGPNVKGFMSLLTAPLVSQTGATQAVSTGIHSRTFEDLIASALVDRVSRALLVEEETTVLITYIELLCSLEGRVSALGDSTTITESFVAFFASRPLMVALLFSTKGHSNRQQPAKAVAFKPGNATHDVLKRLCVVLKAVFDEGRDAFGSLVYLVDYGSSQFTQLEQNKLARYFLLSPKTSMDSGDSSVLSSTKRVFVRMDVCMAVAQGGNYFKALVHI